MDNNLSGITCMILYAFFYILIFLGFVHGNVYCCNTNLTVDTQKLINSMESCRVVLYTLIQLYIRMAACFWFEHNGTTIKNRTETFFHNHPSHIPEVLHHASCLRPSAQLPSALPHHLSAVPN